MSPRRKTTKTTKPAEKTRPAEKTTPRKRAKAKPKPKPAPPPVSGRRFAFIGGFDCSPGEADDRLLAGMVETAGGAITGDIDAALDYLVVGNRRGPSKIARRNLATRLIADGAPMRILSEEAFLALVQTGTPLPSPGAEMDFPGFIRTLYAVVDTRKLGRALDMLRQERCSLYSNLHADQLVGIVRSQAQVDRVYAPWLTAAGHYGCAQPDLSDCLGLQGTVCKHLLVLIVGLVRAGQAPMSQAIGWISAAASLRPRANHDLCAGAFIQYKGAQAGEVDWRPTETIPEDYYAL